MGSRFPVLGSQFPVLGSRFSDNLTNPGVLRMIHMVPTGRGAVW